MRTRLIAAAVLLVSAAACSSSRTPPADSATIRTLRDSGMKSPTDSGMMLRDSGMKSPTDSGMELRSAPAAEDPRVQLRTDRTSYAPGATVNLTIVNGSDVALGYNACQRIVERREGTAWTAVAEEGRMCTMQIKLVAAGATTTDTTDLPADLANGEYRLALVMTTDEAGGTTRRVRATSAGFQVQR